MNVKELTRGEKDMFILGMIAAQVNTSQFTVGEKKKKGVEEERKVDRMRSFMFNQRQLCRFGFFYLFDLTIKTFTRIKRHFKENGAVPRKMEAGIND
jgi:hypothetical protein